MMNDIKFGLDYTDNYTDNANKSKCFAAKRL